MGARRAKALNCAAGCSTGGDGVLYDSDNGMGQLLPKCHRKSDNIENLCLFFI